MASGLGQCDLNDLCKQSNARRTAVEEKSNRICNHSVKLWLQLVYMKRLWSCNLRL